MKTTSHPPNNLPLLRDDDVASPSPTVAPEIARWLILGTVVGPILFTLTWLILDFLHPGYSPVSHYISDLELGPGGNVMRAVYILTGVFLSIGVIAVLQSVKHQVGVVARWSCILLLLLSPLGVLWDGIFTINMLALHNVGVYLAAGTPVVALPIVGLVLRRVPGWRRLGTWMLIGSLLTLVLIIGFSTAVPPSELPVGGGSIGLWQRALITEIQAWYVVLGWLTFRRSSRVAG